MGSHSEEINHWGINERKDTKALRRSICICICICFLYFSITLQKSGELCTQESTLPAVGFPRIGRRDAAICFSYFWMLDENWRSLPWLQRITRADWKDQRLHLSMMMEKTMTSWQISHCSFLWSRMHAMKDQVGYRLIADSILQLRFTTFSTWRPRPSAKCKWTIDETFLPTRSWWNNGWWLL